MLLIDSNGRAKEAEGPLPVRVRLLAWPGHGTGSPPPRGSRSRTGPDADLVPQPDLPCASWLPSDSRLLQAPQGPTPNSYRAQAPPQGNLPPLVARLPTLRTLHVASCRAWLDGTAVRCPCVCARVREREGLGSDKVLGWGSRASPPPSQGAQPNASAGVHRRWFQLLRQTERGE